MPGRRCRRSYAPGLCGTPTLGDGNPRVCASAGQVSHKTEQSEPAQARPRRDRLARRSCDAAAARRSAHRTRGQCQRGERGGPAARSRRAARPAHRDRGLGGRDLRGRARGEFGRRRAVCGGCARHIGTDLGALPPALAGSLGRQRRSGPAATAAAFAQRAVVPLERAARTPSARASPWPVALVTRQRQRPANLIRSSTRRVSRPAPRTPMMWPLRLPLS